MVNLQKHSLLDFPLTLLHYQNYTDHTPDVGY